MRRSRRASGRGQRTWPPPHLQSRSHQPAQPRGATLHITPGGWGCPGRACWGDAQLLLSPPPGLGTPYIGGPSLPALPGSAQPGMQEMLRGWDCAAVPSTERGDGVWGARGRHSWTGVTFSTVLTSSSTTPSRLAAPAQGTQCHPRPRGQAGVWQGTGLVGSGCRRERRGGEAAASSAAELH